MTPPPVSFDWMRPDPQSLLIAGRRLAMRGGVDPANMEHLIGRLVRAARNDQLRRFVAEGANDA